MATVPLVEATLRIVKDYFSASSGGERWCFPQLDLAYQLPFIQVDDLDRVVQIIRDVDDVILGTKLHAHRSPAHGDSVEAVLISLQGRDQVVGIPVFLEG